MNILQIGVAYVGAQKEIEYSIHKHLLKNGHQSYILYAQGNSIEDNIIKYENCFENLLIRKYVSKSPRCAFFSTLKVIYYIKRFKPDLVHLHVLHHGYVDYILLLRYLAKVKIPVVYTAHDMWLNTGGCYYYTKANCNAFQESCKNCPLSSELIDCATKHTEKYLKIKKELVSKLHKFSVVSVSEWVQNEIKRSFLSIYPMYCIPNAIKDEEYITAEKKHDRFTIIGVAACWDDRKGLKRFIELAEKVCDYADILLIGDVPENCIVPSNVKLYGRIDDKQALFKLYSSSDLHVSLSFEETFGLTFIEAALNGIKSIGFSSTAIPYVLNKTFGYIAESCTVTEVADIIKNLSADRSECCLSKNQIEIVKDTFSSEKMAVQYTEVYKNLLNK